MSQSTLHSDMSVSPMSDNDNGGPVVLCQVMIMGVLCQVMIMGFCSPVSGNDNGGPIVLCQVMIMGVQC